MAFRKLSFQWTTVRVLIIREIRRKVRIGTHYKQPSFSTKQWGSRKSCTNDQRTTAKTKDPYLALLAYRSTPLATGQTPAQLLMGRQLRTTLLSHPSQLAPEWPDIEQFRAQDKQYRAQQNSNYNRRHRVTTLPDLKPGERVWHRELNQPATIIREAGTPWSYIVSTPRGTLRRNRRALVFPGIDRGNTPTTSLQSFHSESRKSSHYPSHRIFLHDEATGQPVGESGSHLID